jgi:aminoglycoside 3-N-acetyltransferase
MAVVTVASLVAELRGIGLAAGDVLLMHSSYRSVGRVAGGPQAVVEALVTVLGPAGTLVVPTHTPDNSDPATWQHPPVPAEWWAPIRDEAPGFDPDRTPASQWMGRLAELVRTWPGAVRSDRAADVAARAGRVRGPVDRREPRDLSRVMRLAPSSVTYRWPVGRPASYVV